MPLRFFFDDSKTIQARIPLVRRTMWVVFLLLLGGFWYLQILRHAEYELRAEKNSIRRVPLVAPRGRILDREGRMLVDNRPSFSLAILVENNKHFMLNLNAIAQGVGLERKFILERLERMKNSPSFQPVILKEDISRADIAFVEAHRREFPELEIIQVPRRLYPSNELAAHVLGYVGEVTPEMLDSKWGQSVRPGDVVGKSGLEFFYNDYLAGRDGYKKVIVNSVGREMGKLEQVNPVPGNELRLTVDLDLQEVAEQAIGERTGAVVVLDPRNGEVLATVSRPAFDPNEFATRISMPSWRKLIEDERKPLLNRAIQTRFSPGSVFKVIMAAAGLEAGVLNAHSTYYCGGSVNFYGNTFHCHGGRGHGWVGLHQAIVNSCNIYFYNVGKNLGIDRIDEFAGRVGLGARTGVDLPSEDAGLIPSPEWKRRTYKQQWYAGETISVAIGQGAVGVTPLQLVRTISGIAMGGVFPQPHLVLSDNQEAAKSPWKRLAEYNQTTPLKKETVEEITRGLWGVVNEGGTGHRALVHGVEICGKTGTVQVISAEGKKKAQAKRGLKKNLTDHGWFVGFAPKNNPEIAVAVLVEHGGMGGDVSAPIAQDIFRTYFEKKSRRGEGLKLAQQFERMFGMMRPPVWKRD